MEILYDPSIEEFQTHLEQHFEAKVYFDGRTYLLTGGKGRTWKATDRVGVLKFSWPSDTKLAIIHEDLELGHVCSICKRQIIEVKRFDCMHLFHARCLGDKKRCPFQC
jgi:hypothetical protein